MVWGFRALKLGWSRRVGHGGGGVGAILACPHLSIPILPILSYPYLYFPILIYPFLSLTYAYLSLPILTFPYPKVEETLSTFGFTQYEVNLSTRPEKSVGDDDIWNTAEAALTEALNNKVRAHS